MKIYSKKIKFLTYLFTMVWFFFNNFGLKADSLPKITVKIIKEKGFRYKITRWGKPNNYYYSNINRRKGYKVDSFLYEIDTSFNKNYVTIIVDYKRWWSPCYRSHIHYIVEIDSILDKKNILILYHDIRFKFKYRIQYKIIERPLSFM